MEASGAGAVVVGVTHGDPMVVDAAAAAVGQVRETAGGQPRGAGAMKGSGALTGERLAAGVEAAGVEAGAGGGGGVAPGEGRAVSARSRIRRSRT